MEQKIIKIKQELQANYKFIKYDGLILETFASNLLKLCNCDVNKTIEYLETLSKKYITDKFICIVKDFETSFEISEIIKSSIQIETDKLKVKQTKVNELDKETDELLEYKEELKADLAKLKAEHKKTNDDYLEFEEELKADLAKLEITKGTLQNTIDGVYRNELYEDEFNIPECKYILKEPTIHLNVDKIIEDLTNNTCEITNINKNILIDENQNQYIEDHSKCQSRCFGNCGQTIFHKDNDKLNIKIKLNFPINFKLNNDEIIVKIYVLNGNIFKNDIFNDYDTPYKIPTIYSIIYITNFGRFIKSDDLILIPSIYKYSFHNSAFGGTDNYTFSYIKILDTNIIYENNKAKISKTKNRSCTHTYCLTQYQGCRCGYANILKMQIGGEHNKINLVELPILTFRMPRIFLDVIDAFQTQNNDLMQECCKRYLDITRETARKTEILTTLQFNKTIKEKDDIITKKENIIKEHSIIIDYQNEELEKLKNENAKLKKALQSFLNT